MVDGRHHVSVGRDETGDDKASTTAAAARDGTRGSADRAAVDWTVGGGGVKINRGRRRRRRCDERTGDRRDACTESSDDARQRRQRTDPPPPTERH